MSVRTALHLQYGVNVFADTVYEDYQPLKLTAHYPDPFCSELRRALADYTGLPEDMILVASGSDELIDAYIRLQKTRLPDLKIAFSPPTYPQYAAYTAREQVPCIVLPHDRASISAELILQLGGDPKNTAVMLDSPANPSGEIMNTEQFLGILDAGFQLFVDEAYIEFAGQTMANYIATYPDQLVVSRSLSKFAAMAGNRVGYLLADAKMVTDMRERQLFFNVNSEGQHRALYALQHIAAFHAAVADMRRAKQQVAAAIRDVGAYTLFPSLDMYTIFKHRDLPTSQLHHELQVEHNINTTRFPTFKDHDVIRAAILQMPLMEQLVSALGQYATVSPPSRVNIS